MSTKSVIEFPKDYVVLDLETTGLSAKFDAIIEIAVIRYRDDKPKASFSSIINPAMPIPTRIQRLTGITNDDAVKSPYINEVIEHVIDFIGSDYIIGHNINFDINFLNNVCESPIANKTINTVRISHKLNPELESHTLDALKDLYNINLSSHRATSDCESTALVYQTMKKDILSKMTLDEFKAKYKKLKPNQQKITTDKTEFDEDNFFYNKKVVFTGKLEKYTRNEACQIIVDLGGSFTNTVSSKVDVLVVGDTDYSSAIEGRITSKHKKATELQEKGSNIIIISESDFINLIEQ